MLTIDTRPDVTIAVITGRLDGITTPTIEPGMTEALAAGRSVVVDLEGLTYVASVGLRLLLLAAKRSAQAGHGFAVCGLQPQVLEVFEVSGLDMLMTVCPTRADAIAALS